MSVSSITPTDPYQPSSNPTNTQKLRTDFQELAGALSAGNLAQAQQAFGAIANDAPNLLKNGPAADGLNAIGQALQTGNIGAAQDAFSALQQAAQSHGHRHHHHHGSSADSNAAAPTTPADSTASAADGIGTQIDTLA